MLRKISQQQSEQQLKNQSIRIGDESEFNLRKFRESIYTKMQQFGNSDQQQIYVKRTAQSITKKPTMNQSLGDIPSFDEICKKMTGYKDVIQLNQKNDRSLRSSMQNKIEQFRDPPQNRLSQRSIGMTLHISNRFSSQTKIEPRQQSACKHTSSIFDKPVMSQTLKSSLMDKLSLKELVDLRNKVENSQSIEVQSLSKNYVAELMKLTQIINKQLKKCKL